ncbi:hypothetical protein ABZ695_15155 [Streptomyces sp. NPDC006976]|uniref:hypothetical protein n=1 Tax=Streptomyces sp. NPDC006976 TaxID=3154311 RepID=UPI0033C68C6F
MRTKLTMYKKLLRSVLAVAFAATAFAAAAGTGIWSPDGGDVSWDNMSLNKFTTSDVSWDVLPAGKDAAP